MNSWRQLSNDPGQCVGKMKYRKALVCKQRRNSDCHPNLGIMRRMLLYIQPQCLIRRMEVDKVGIFKNPGGACPLAFEVLKQMKRQPKKLVAIRKCWKFRPIPALRLPARKSLVIEP